MVREWKCPKCDEIIKITDGPEHFIAHCPHCALEIVVFGHMIFDFHLFLANAHQA
jgi:uncharacterized paraquat-inducible protein A